MDANARGEDRSAYQPVKPWTGLSFGFCKATEGTAYRDPSLAENAANLKRERTSRGFYHFLHPSQDPVRQARFFASVIKPLLEPGDMAVVDSELLSGVADRGRAHMPVTVEDLALSEEQVDDATLAFLNELRDLIGSEHPILVYTMHEVGQYLVKTAAAYPLVWFAHPGSEPDAALLAPWKHWTFWQYGIKDNTDQDVFNGSPVDLSAFITSYLPLLRHVIHWRVIKPVSLAAVAKRHRMTPEEMIRLGERQLGFRNELYGRAMQHYIKRGDWNARLPLLTELFAYAPVHHAA